MKYVVFDAGPLISLTMNGMLETVEEMKKNFKGEFIITPSVKREVIDKPMKIKKYKLEAIQVSDLLKRGILKLSTDLVSEGKLDKETKKILKLANGMLRSTEDNHKINILHEGEASCLAFANLCSCDNLLVMDERTTRVLLEAPQNLENMMERKLHMPLDSNFAELKRLGNTRIIRSAEFLFVAYKKNLIHLEKKKDTLDAMLYGLKFKGTAISSGEIETMKRLV